MMGHLEYLLMQEQKEDSDYRDAIERLRVFLCTELSETLSYLPNLDTEEYKHWYPDDKLRVRVADIDTVLNDRYDMYNPFDAVRVITSDGVFDYETEKDKIDGNVICIPLTTECLERLKKFRY
jgi:ribosomal protein S8